ncbi:MAG TPA: DNA-binding protein [Gammaproteobacteria bacterium]|nr:DNA-binding protein [Gammaproteobacteria bacterium]
MEIRHLTQRELAERWRISEATLERWRGEGLGPQYLKLHGRVLYRLVDVEAYEAECLRYSTTESAKRTYCLVKDLAGQ